MLSPLLFNIFIDDMKNTFNDSCDPVKMLECLLPHLLYADNLVLLSTSETGLNNCLKQLGDVCEANGWLKVHVPK